MNAPVLVFVQLNGFATAFTRCRFTSVCLATTKQFTEIQWSRVDWIALMLIQFLERPGPRTFTQLNGSETVIKYANGCHCSSLATMNHGTLHRCARSNFTNPLRFKPFRMADIPPCRSDDDLHRAHVRVINLHFLVDIFSEKFSLKTKSSCDERQSILTKNPQTKRKCHARNVQKRRYTPIPTPRSKKMIYLENNMSEQFKNTKYDLLVSSNRRQETIQWIWWCCGGVLLERHVTEFAKR